MTLALYARVSTSDQNCAVQIAELRQYAEARGWPISEDFVDTGVSGAKASRPQLDRLMKLALARKIDTIIVTKLDRWGRSTQDLANSLATLRSAGVRLIVVSQGIDTDVKNPASKFFFDILAAVAEFERELINERTRMGWNRYKDDYEAGKPVKSKSGRNMPIGRPKSIFDREKVRALRQSGASWNAIAAATGVKKTTLRRAVMEA